MPADKPPKEPGSIPAPPQENPNAGLPGWDPLARALGASPPGESSALLGEYWLGRVARERQKGTPVADKAGVQFRGGESSTVEQQRARYRWMPVAAVIVAAFAAGVFVAFLGIGSDLLDLSGHRLTTIGTWAEVAILLWMVWERFNPKSDTPMKPLAHGVSGKKGLRDLLIENRTLIFAAIGLVIVVWLNFRERAPTSVPPAPTIAQPQQQSFGFQSTALNIPSKLYSDKEKQALLNLIGSISENLNDKGLPASELARVTGYNAVTPSKDGLNDALSRANSVAQSLVEIQRLIWNDILQPKNSNFLTDLNYVIENNEKFDQFQRATDRFSGTIENFQRNFDSLTADQRNWITSLIQIGAAQVWAQNAEQFQAWIQQCNSRIDKEREGLK